MRGARGAAAAGSVLPAGPALGAAVLHRVFDGPWICSVRHAGGELRFEKSQKLNSATPKSGEKGITVHYYCELKLLCFK